MGKTPEQVVQAQVDAYNAHDIAAFSGCYSPDAVVSRLASGQVLAFDRNAIQTTWGYFFAIQPSVRCTILQRIVQGRFVVDQEEITGLSDRQTLHSVAIYEVKDEAIHRLWLTGE